MKPGAEELTKIERLFRSFSYPNPIPIYLLPLNPHHFLTGSERPDEVVLLSGHIDSWDVGQGAMDDGGGMAAVWQAMLTIKRLADENPAFQPKRTIRGVYWTAEEQGLFGAKHYFEEHKNGSETFFFVSETDQGAFRPRTLKSKFNFMGNKTAQNRIQQIANVLTDNGIPISVNPSTLQVSHFRILIKASRGFRSPLRRFELFFVFFLFHDPESYSYFYSSG